MYVKSWAHIISMSIVLLSTIYTSLSVFMKQMPKLPKMVFIITGLAALYLSINRNVYLPFLGETVYPCDGIVEKTPDNADKSITITVPPNVKVIYWASEPHEGIVSNPWDAYGKYDNTGVTTSGSDGSAVLKVRSPSSYKIPSGRVLKPHVHYRYCQESGILSEVKTVSI